MIAKCNENDFHSSNELVCFRFIKEKDRHKKLEASKRTFNLS